MEIPEYCREIETYLCQKNDGHLIRVVGPSFELVSRWAADGVPIKVAFKGIDRYFERYYRKGPRRRPVRIDFCEADVLDVFEEWRRAVGVSAASAGSASVESSADSREDSVPATRRGASLPAHLERVVLRLSNARATGALGADADGVLDAIAVELDRARANTHGLRGEQRQALLNRLIQMDVELLDVVRKGLRPAERQELDAQAEEELAAFRTGMPPDVYARARAAAADRLLRERFGLPTTAFE